MRARMFVGSHHLAWFGAAATLILSLAARTAAAECLPPTPTQPQGNYIVPGVLGGIVYSRGHGHELKLDAWIPARARGRPAVMVIHGGGYTTGSRVAFVGQFLELLSDAGVPWFSVGYRLGAPEPRAAALEDVRAAIGFVRCRSGAFDIEAGRLVLLGEDSGAEIALALARDPRNHIAGAILIGGSYVASRAGRDHAASVAVHTGRRLPNPAEERAKDSRAGAATRRAFTGSRAASRRESLRVLFVNGTADTEQRIDDVGAVCDRLRGSNAACDVLPVVRGIHRAENWRPEQWGYKRRVVGWLKQMAAANDGGAWEGRLPAAPLPGGRLAPGLHKRILWDSEHGLTLDAWLPRADRRAPAVLVFHGGGWEAGDRVTYVTPLFDPLARAGLAWMSIDYRLTPDVRHPEQLDDLRRAVAFVRTHARQFHIDPARLVLVGESASGQMVTLLATEDRSLAGVVSFYGVYDFEPMVTDASPRSLTARLFGRHELDDHTRALLRQYSPLHQAHAGMPPVLLIHGTNEGLWEQGLAMAERLQALGVPHELLRVEGAPHGMENWEGHVEWEEYKQKLIEWIGMRKAEGGRRN